MVVKHSGNITLDQVIKVAKILRERSYANKLSGTVKEVLGTCQYDCFPFIILALLVALLMVSILLPLWNRLIMVKLRFPKSKIHMSIVYVDKVIYLFVLWNFQEEYWAV